MMVPVRVTTFGREINRVETRNFQDLVSELAGGSSRSVFFCNVHMLMLAQEDEVLAAAMDQADWVFADGVPVAWLQRRLSGKDAQVIRGYEIMLAVCEHAVKNGEKVGFMGASPRVMKPLVSKLSERFEALSVAYRYCPPFVQGELVSTEADLLAIKESGIKWLFIGLGCPKQEKWVARYSPGLNCSVLAVGAAFDWLSGASRKPPDWIENIGGAWLFRLMQNPRRMWRRYLIYNSLFVIKIVKLLLWDRPITKLFGGKSK